ncbi:membrane protein insertase YidC [Bacteroidetes bacterium endosymbiont of Geopemphigus sp.]|uniref:membrane protein insertase YidC n=1 Tax=Bacteroidetes bacterium endosymbiont of Geopemphigus sp. TaxID=2047937 RepID=UPI000CD2C842|nr:membrane protein insertase YidC [Bacteroidetes bacterium endosymbiont of Geopemphigus sp.]
MQVRKIDYNSLIGSVLISLILIGFIYFNKPFEQQTINDKTSSLSKSFTPVEALEKPLAHPLNTGKTGESILENDVLRVKVSNLGGEINEVLLKQYNAYDHKNADHPTDLYLVKPGTFSFGLNLQNLQKEKISSRSLFFTPDLKETYTHYKLTMRALLPSGGELNYTYVLPKKEAYKLDFNIRTRGILSFALADSVSLNWKQKAMSFEKSSNWENNYTQMYYAYRNREKVKYLSETGQDEEEVRGANWLANKQQFFTSILSSEQAFKEVKIQSKTLHSKSDLKWFQVSAPLELVSNELDYKGEWYFAPLNYDLLKAYGQNFEDVIPFGWGILKWLNKYFFLVIFQLLEKTQLNYGIIIILMTIVVKLILSPITYRQYRLSAMMKVIRPEIEELNAKLKGANPLKKQQATIELYRKTGVNPMSGCLPALLQIPIFYALFKFFPTVINLRGRPFLWADDLTSYDSIYHLPFSVPLYGDHVSLFTLLYAGALLVYTKISGSGNMSQPGQEGMPDIRFMIYLMPLMMLLFINSYASGLSLYYFVSNTLNIALIFIIKRYILDEKSIHKRIQENKSKPKKKSLWQERLQKMMKEAQKQQSLKKNQSKN